ncbi:OLC1v1005606C1 [Oldenlandia corymbosa var. corymbosa]|uniref:OLC1v1005606C1 n=1 Tax=Oldenlandia corymbosa var. corymbosa TaxID=529605 RepID=A0AAV1DEY6_OLDCO|nr:OLC1v1005606C1 [Oldenlandia corymbosa var. corymbosa]
MKVARKVILLFKDGSSGGGESFADALQPNPNSKIQRLEDSFELSLEKYGIKDQKASGNVFQFVNADGVVEVSIFLLDNYATPLLACALNEVFAAILGEDPSNIPTLVVPFLVEASKLKFENKNSKITDTSLYGWRFGPVNDSTQAIVSKIQTPPEMQINHEQLACMLHLVRLLDVPTFVLVGKFSLRSPSNESLQVINEIGDYVAKFSSLSFIKERVKWSPPKSSKIDEEPWRALYG